jgi:hypothetical protein
VQTQISNDPDLAETKAIFVPSRENLGSSSSRVEEMNLRASFGFAPKPGTSTLQKLASIRHT